MEENTKKIKEERKKRSMGIETGRDGGIKREKDTDKEDNVRDRGTL